MDTLTKSLIWVIGVEMSKQRLSTFYMLQNLEGEPLPGLPCYTGWFFLLVCPKNESVRLHVNPFKKVLSVRIS